MATGIAETLIVFLFILRCFKKLLVVVNGAIVSLSYTLEKGNEEEDQDHRSHGTDEEGGDEFAHIF